MPEHVPTQRPAPSRWLHVPAHSPTQVPIHAPVQVPLHEPVHAAAQVPWQLPVQLPAQSATTSPVHSGTIAVTLPVQRPWHAAARLMSTDHTGGE